MQEATLHCEIHARAFTTASSDQFAHSNPSCLCRYEAEIFRVRLGAHAIAEVLEHQNMVQRRVTEIHFHPSHIFNSVFNHDIALIRLNERVVVNQLWNLELSPVNITRRNHESSVVYHGFSFFHRLNSAHESSRFGSPPI